MILFQVVHVKTYFYRIITAYNLDLFRPRGQEDVLLKNLLLLADCDTAAINVKNTEGFVKACAVAFLPSVTEMGHAAPNFLILLLLNLWFSSMRKQDRLGNVLSQYEMTLSIQRPLYWLGEQT
jgi:hypothetical protein